MDDYFEDILELLKKGQDPEYWHYYYDVHPGQYWWLKTIFPAPHVKDQWNYARSWMDYAATTNSVFLTDVAFDFFGNVIADTWSVWVFYPFDILIHDNGKGLEFQKVMRHAGTRVAAEEILDLCCDIKTPETEEIEKAANTVLRRLDNLDAKYKRRKFRIIKNG